MDFTGKVAVVTGGTQGLGRAVALHLAKHGAEGVVICGRNDANGRKVVEELQDAGSTAHFVQANLEKAAEAKRVICQCDTQFGRIDHLVNVAAITERGTILDTSTALFDRMFSINVKSPFFMIQEAANTMIRENTQGSMVNILSMSSHGGQPFICAYSGSKAALAGITKNAAFSLMRNRIRINGLNIGWMDTPGEHAIQKTAHDADEDWLDQAEQHQPFGRLLKTEEVARAVAFLLSEESGMMTGSIVDFDQSVLGCYDAPPQPQEAL